MDRNDRHTAEELYRIEAEVRSDSAAEFLREAIENNPDCTLTAFDEAITDE